MGSWRSRGRGGPIGSPAPGGSGRAPPSQGCCSAVLLSPPLPSRVPGQGMSCSRRSLPGARGQGGPGCVLPSAPPRLLPAQVRAAAAPDSRRPRAGAALGVGRRGAGEPGGERARRRHLAAAPLAGGRPQRPLGRRHLHPRLGSRSPSWRPAERPLGPGAGKESMSPNRASQALLRSHPPSSVHSLFCWSCPDLVSDF